VVPVVVDAVPVQTNLNTPAKIPLQRTSSFLKALSRLEKKYGHVNAMPDARGRGPQKQVGDESVAMRTHCHEVAAPLPDPFDNFRGRFTVS
jgi:hypothetical protein